MIQGIKTKFYSDVKMPIHAGMQFGTNNNKMRPSTFIKKHSNCPVLTEKAIDLFNKSIVQYQLSSDEIKQSYIKQIKQNLKSAELYAEHYILAAKAFLKYIQL